MSLLTEISAMLQEYPECKTILNTPITVRATLHQHVFTIYGAWSGEDGVWLMDGEGCWHGPVKEAQLNANYIINSLFQRLKLKEHASPASN